jgi:hypothetical protein
MDDIEQDQAIARAKRIITKLGGVEAVCRITGRSRTRVYSWTYPRDKHGTGGLIPPACQIAMVQHAREAKLPLVPDDFFPDKREDAA